MRYFRKMLLWVFILLCSGFVFGQAAWAVSIIPDNLIIDFRNKDIWGGANGQQSFSPAGSVVTAEALPLWLDATLYQDPFDGLGVQSARPAFLPLPPAFLPLPDDESDEIDSIESLRVEITGGMFLTGVWITDLFGPNDGDPTNDPYKGEQGQVTLNAGPGNEDSFNFFGDQSQGTNGELFVSFGKAILVEEALFSISGGFFDNEFSVAGFTPVPEPGTIVLLAIGLIGVGAYGRRKGILFKRK